MSGRGRRMGCLAIVLILSAGLGGSWWYWLDRQWTPEKIDTAIRFALPPGSSKERVETWLDSQNIPYSQIVSLEGSLTRELLADIEDIPRAFDWSMDIQIYFHFDENDRLLWHRVDWFSVSL